MKDMLIQARDGLVDSIVTIAPRALVALAILLVGLIVSSITESLLRRLLKRDGSQALLERMGLTGMLRKMGDTRGAAYWIHRSVYFLVLALFLRSVVSTLGLDILSDAVGTVLRFSPRVLAAVVILVVGLFASRVVASVVSAVGKSAEIPLAMILARIAAAVVIAIAGMMAIGQLGIEAAILQILATAIAAGLALGLALTFGLGTRDVSRNIMAGFYARRTYRPGSRIEVGDVKGEVIEVTPVQLFIKVKGGVVGVPNSTILDRSIKS
jgi:small-conductance mechanosensitive channel